MFKRLLLSVLVCASLGVQASAQSPINEGDYKAWQMLIRHALNESIKAYGKSTYDRFCEPEKQVCTNFMYYPIGDKKVFLREVMNKDERVFLRDICHFNTSGDIRWCKNFDTGAMREDMKGPDNKWVTVDGSAF